ncbi:flagellar basal body P-ring formation protein FlgA [Thiorhodococcus mannitoliphagus]|uniref:Flagella basal body P-ring formation protein FlgA n=1 Tax=Thiorhodococcus mannitoliphagus TaxID=329406 RepID=A0A6P1DS29_9GAMM|nr:flagellar basal body P-ring formation chaperone FlgA [Thiorhodococcus mannitoliphagus]NEX21077.1 flagellar basal body P-ring formation protein FlgA [Thiorhodococcus mannitoliphagus]
MTFIPHHCGRRIKGRLALIACAGLILSSAMAHAGETEPLERILESARSFLAQRLSDDPSTETRIELGQLDSRLKLRRCAHIPTAQLAPGGRTDGNTTVNVRCSEPVGWSIFVPVRIERHAEVVVTARALARKQLIKGQDVRLERKETSGLTSGYFSDPAAVIGQETKRRLVPGQVLTASHVAPPQLVERGQEVILYAVRPGLTVRMKGEALEDGAEGQRIRVRNRSSKRVVEGYVEPSGAIRVAL